MLPRLLNLFTFIAIFFVSGCQTTNKNNTDPYEGYNRVMFGINQGVDTVVMKPVSYVYIKFVPSPIQYGVGNFFDNMREVTNVANDVLQFKIAYAVHDATRFLINTTIGIFGFFDPASSLGLEHRKEDFGQTLYHWGYKDSAYLILPFMGPSTIRDAIGLGVDFYGLSIWPWINSDKRYIMMGVDFLDIRARILRKETVLDVVAIDDYVFMRNAYFQHRQYLFSDGKSEDVSSNDSFDEIFKAEKAKDNKTDQPKDEKLEESAKTEQKPKSEKQTTVAEKKTEKTIKQDVPLEEKSKKTKKEKNSGIPQKSEKIEKEITDPEDPAGNEKTDPAESTPPTI